MAKNRPNKHRRAKAKAIKEGVAKQVTLNTLLRSTGSMEGHTVEIGGGGRAKAHKASLTPGKVNLGAKAARFRDPAGGGFMAKVINRPGRTDLPWRVVNQAGGIVSEHATEREARLAMQVRAVGLPRSLRLTVKRRPGNV